MMDWVVAEAPSNIALIKYMGKIAPPAKGTDELAVINTPTNASLSYTLDHLRTRVRVRWESAASDQTAFSDRFAWRPLIEDGYHAPKLSSAGQARFLRHAERCLQRLAGSDFEFGSRKLVVESANGFPSDCGLASSASSFAALTLAMAKLLGREIEDFDRRKELSRISREGSGSSCRSFFTPWATWRDAGAEPVQGFPVLIRHLAIIVDDEKKAVSSSEAHVRVTTSLLFRGRVERAEERLRLLTDNMKRALSATDHDGIRAWNRAAHLVWGESWDMHALFESSEPPFGYFVPGSVRALNALRATTDEMKNKFGVDRFREPMVTMDAGPNVHVLICMDEFTEIVVARIKAVLNDVRIIDSGDFKVRR